METQDKLPSADHDVLIELKTEFKAFVRQYGLDMKELKDGTAKTLIEHESAIKKNADNIDKQDARLKTVEDFKRLFIWITAPIYVAAIGILVKMLFEFFTKG